MPTVRLVCKNLLTGAAILHRLIALSLVAKQSISPHQRLLSTQVDNAEASAWRGVLAVW